MTAIPTAPLDFAAPPATAPAATTRAKTRSTTRATTRETTRATPPPGDLRLMPVSEHLWRVLDPRGRVIGHLRVSGDRAQRRFVALRFHASDRRFREVGAFWTRAEALECLRLSR